MSPALPETRRWWGWGAGDGGRPGQAEDPGEGCWLRRAGGAAFSCTWRPDPQTNAFQRKPGAWVPVERGFVGCGEYGNLGFGAVQRGWNVPRGPGFLWEIGDSLTPRWAPSSSPPVPGALCRKSGSGAPLGASGTRRLAVRGRERPPWGRGPLGRGVLPWPKTRHVARHLEGEGKGELGLHPPPPPHTPPRSFLPRGLVLPGLPSHRSGWPGPQAAPGQRPVQELSGGGRREQGGGGWSCMSAPHFLAFSPWTVTSSLLNARTRPPAVTSSAWEPGALSSFLMMGFQSERDGEEGGKCTLSLSFLFLDFRVFLSFFWHLFFFV